MMSKIRAILMKTKCEECGKERTTLIPLIIREDDWLKTKKEYGELILADDLAKVYRMDFKE